MLYVNSKGSDQTAQMCKLIQDFAVCKGHALPFSNDLPYFFGYKTEIFSFQSNPKDLDPSSKTDLDLWDCLGRVKLVLLQ